MSRRGMFLMKKIFFSLIIFISFSYAQSSQDELKRLLAVIQGTFNDKVYTITIQKAKEYLLKAPENDPYKEKVLKILAYSYAKTNKIDKLLDLIDYIEKIKTSKETKSYIYKLAVAQLPDNEKKVNLLLKLYQIENKNDYLIAASNILYKNKKWEELLNLPDNKKINHIKVYALYKLGEYKKLVKFAEDLNKFTNDKKDFVLYYLGMSHIKLGSKKKAVSVFESLKNKNPEIIKFLASYYFKNKDYEKAEKYFNFLLFNEKEKPYTLFYLGLIQENKKNYKKALSYYKKLLEEKNSKFRVPAIQKILTLKAKKIVPKEEFYSIRIILYKNEETAVKYIKKYKLEQCFVYPFKQFYGVYCGLYLDKKNAKQDLEIFRKRLKVKDILFTKISI